MLKVLGILIFLVGLIGFLWGLVIYIPAFWAFLIVRWALELGIFAAFWVMVIGGFMIFGGD